MSQTQEHSFLRKGPDLLRLPPAAPSGGHVPHTSNQSPPISAPRAVHAHHTTHTRLHCTTLTLLLNLSCYSLTTACCATLWYQLPYVTTCNYPTLPLVSFPQNSPITSNHSTSSLTYPSPVILHSCALVCVHHYSHI